MAQGLVMFEEIMHSKGKTIERIGASLQKSRLNEQGESGAIHALTVFWTSPGWGFIPGYVHLIRSPYGFKIGKAVNRNH